jgi:hypothetical protein
MLGFDIQIATDEKQENIIFHFQDLLMEWAQNIIKANKGKQLSFNGYPNKYEIKAEHLLNELKIFEKNRDQTFLSDDMHLTDSFEGYEAFIAILEKLNPEQILYIEAWDLS